MTTPVDLDELVTISVRATVRDLVAINRRADLNAFDGRARGEFILGCALGAPHAQLLERVRQTRDVERARFRTELDAARVERTRKCEGARARATRQ